MATATGNNMFARFFIDRPIFAAVLSIVITLAGGIAVWTLPVAQYPEITPPTVEVSAYYPGTNLNIAQVLVQTRVSLAQPVLPDLVKRRGVTVTKKSPSILMIVNLFS